MIAKEVIKALKILATEERCYFNEKSHPYESVSYTVIRLEEI